MDNTIKEIINKFVPEKYKILLVKEKPYFIQ